MGELRLLSWNIQKYYESKEEKNAGVIVNMLGQMLDAHNIDIAFVMEVMPGATTAVMSHIIGALQHTKWIGVPINVTGPGGTMENYLFIYNGQRIECIGQFSGSVTRDVNEQPLGYGDQHYTLPMASPLRGAPFNLTGAGPFYKSRNPAYALFKILTTNIEFMFIGYHAPFDDQYIAACVARIADAKELVKYGGAGGMQPLITNAVVAGDFNLDYDATIPYNDPYPNYYANNQSNQSRRASQRGYGPLVHAGLTPYVDQYTSLTSAEAGAKLVNPADTQAFGASKYDHFFIKGPHFSSPKNAFGALPIIDWIKASAPHFTLPINATLIDAFVYYRKKISDHLPIVAVINDSAIP